MALGAICPSCRNPIGPGERFCSHCRRELPQAIDQEARAQALATIAASQDQVTWLAFSLAMTTEAVLIVAFVQDIGERGRIIVSAIGLLLGLSFILLVMRSNADMGALYGRGEDVFPDVFHVNPQRRFGPRASCVMAASLLGRILFWIVALVVSATLLLV